MFEHTEFEDNLMYVDSPDPWELISSLKPKVLRFPDGSGGKFSRMLGSENKDINDIDYNTWNGGYGFNLTEIIPYYDITDGILDHSSWTAEDVIILDPDLASDWIWIEDIHVADFFTLVQHYQAQIKYNPLDYLIYPGQEDEPLYINEFIKLIEKIETDNEYTVDVIICLDIINETAEQCKLIIDYLQTNDLYAVNVVGVELGNEVYSNFYADAMGFKLYGELGEFYNAFEFYWEYVSGGDYNIAFDFTDAFELEDVLPADMLISGAHNYFAELKGDPDYPDVQAVKIGIPAKNLGVGFAFRSFGALENWND